MKRLLHRLFFVLTAPVLASCVFDATLDTLSPEASIVTRGCVSIISINGEDFSVTVDSVTLADVSKNVDVDANINLLPDQVDFKYFAPYVEILDTTVVREEKFFIVKQLDCLLTLSKDKLYIPIRFTRQIVTVGKNEYPYYYALHFNVETEYLYSDCSNNNRSYYDLILYVYDSKELIGTLKTRVSFFTQNQTCIPISFDVTVDGWQDTSVNSDL